MKTRKQELIDDAMINNTAYKEAMRKNEEAKKAQEKAKNKLSETDEIKLLDDYDKAKNAKDSKEAVKELLQKQEAQVKEALANVKLAAKDRDITKEQKVQIKAKAEAAQKKYLALKTEVKKDDDKKTAQMEIQKEKEQEEFDTKNAVALDPKTKLDIMKKIAAATKVAKDATPAQKQKALEAAKTFAQTEKDKMKTLKKKMDTELKAAKNNQLNKAYVKAKEVYYKQKAVFENVNNVVSKIGGADK